MKKLFLLCLTAIASVHVTPLLAQTLESETEAISYESLAQHVQELNQAIEDLNLKKTELVERVAELHQANLDKIELTSNEIVEVVESGVRMRYGLTTWQLTSPNEQYTLEIQHKWSVDTSSYAETAKLNLYDAISKQKIELDEIELNRTGGGPFVILPMFSQDSSRLVYAHGDWRADTYEVDLSQKNLRPRLVSGSKIDGHIPGADEYGFYPARVVGAFFSSDGSTMRVLVEKQNGVVNIVTVLFDEKSGDQNEFDQQVDEIGQLHMLRLRKLDSINDFFSSSEISSSKYESERRFQALGVNEQSSRVYMSPNGQFSVELKEESGHELATPSINWLMDQSERTYSRSEVLLIQNLSTGGDKYELEWGKRVKLAGPHFSANNESLAFAEHTFQNDIGVVVTQFELGGWPEVRVTEHSIEAKLEQGHKAYNLMFNDEQTAMRFLIKDENGLYYLRDFEIN